MDRKPKNRQILFTDDFEGFMQHYGYERDDVDLRLHGIIDDYVNGRAKREATRTEHYGNGYVGIVDDES